MIALERNASPVRFESQRRVSDRLACRQPVENSAVQPLGHVAEGGDAEAQRHRLALRVLVEDPVHLPGETDVIVDHPDEALAADLA